MSDTVTSASETKMRICLRNKNENIVDDELHFLLKCPQFITERKTLLTNPAILTLQTSTYFTIC
jgi:hypothetical protein